MRKQFEKFAFIQKSCNDKETCWFWGGWGDSWKGILSSATFKEQDNHPWIRKQLVNI